MFKQACAALVSTFVLCGSVRAEETVVFVRHGEKPASGLGQLDCKGLRRALALPAVLDKQFGKPDAIFAPNPSAQKRDAGQSYDYIRPLVTIEPTAIRLGMPVSVQIGFDDVAGLQKALTESSLADKRVFVAWEHRYIVEVARALLTRAGGDASKVPEWKSEDFDSIYVVTLRTDANGKQVSEFHIAQEGLDGMPASCP
jgi:broad specificity phosphatase PhoE